VFVTEPWTQAVQGKIAEVDHFPALQAEHEVAPFSVKVFVMLPAAQTVQFVDPSLLANVPPIHS